MDPNHAHPDSRWLRLMRYHLARFARRRHLKGGVLHKLFGERLFEKRLWKPDRMPFAWGMALGLAIGLLPTYWVQALLAVFFAYVLRVNIPAAVIGTLVTNPLTTLFIVGFQVKVGIWIIGSPAPHDVDHARGIFRTIVSHGPQYLVGSAVTAALAALLGYIAVLVFWNLTTKIRTASKRPRRRPPAVPPAA
jgi:uncharacterized protein